VASRPVPGATITIKGTVVDADHAVFVPRRFTLASEHRDIEIITPFWGFHGCVTVGDEVQVRGQLFDNDAVVVIELDHGIQILR
jgi:hypothetical protein